MRLQESPYNLPLKGKIELLNRWRSKTKLSEWDREAVWYILYTAARKQVCKQFGYISTNPKVKPLTDDATIILVNLLLHRFQDKGVSYSFFVFRVAFSTLLAEHQLKSHNFTFPDNVSQSLMLKRFIWYTRKCRHLGWNYAHPDIEQLVNLHLTEVYQDEKYRLRVKDTVRDNFHEFKAFYSVHSAVALNVFKT